MSKGDIDASIGLTFSLELFRRYQKNGVLQAELPRVPGIRGRCKAFLRLVNGQVVSIYLEDRQGQRYSSDKETLCRLDREKGPFEWTLVSHAAGAIERVSVPKVISPLPWDRLSAWAPQQKDALYLVFTTINGERSLENIKTMVQLPPDLVDELLRILLELNVIMLSAYETGGL